MRAWIIVTAIVGAAAIVIFLWRPWRDDEPASEAEPAVTAAGPERAAEAPPPPAPAGIDAGAAAPGPATTPSAAPPPAAPPRAESPAPAVDGGAPPGVPVLENRGRLQALHKALGAAPELARLYGEFARAGRPMPPAAKKLIEMKRSGASRDALVDYVRTAFTEPPDRALAMRWLDTAAGVGGAPRDGG